MERLESPKYLVYDSPIQKVLDNIARAGLNNRVVLTTMRTNRCALHRQLCKAGIRPLLDKVLARGCNYNRSKADLIESDSGFRRDLSVIIGDTEMDVLAGKSLGIETISVLSGIRCRSALLPYHPDRIVEDASQVNL